MTVEHEEQIILLSRPEYQEERDTDKYNIASFQDPPPTIRRHLEEDSGMLDVKINLLATHLRTLKSGALIKVTLKEEEPKIRVYHDNDPNQKRFFVLPTTKGIPIEIKYSEVKEFSIYREETIF